MLFRPLSAALGLIQTATALPMILTPRHWFFTAPGVAATGPFNPHFVIDAGFGFLGAGLAFLACAWRPRLRPVALGASGFVVFHAIFHLAHLFMGAAAGSMTGGAAVGSMTGGAAVGSMTGGAAVGSMTGGSAVGSMTGGSAALGVDIALAIPAFLGLALSWPRQELPA